MLKHPISKYPAVDIAIMAEGTYPFVRGGVSSVIHQIIEGHPELSFGIIHITWDRQSPSEYQYSLPSQVKWIYPIYLTEYGDCLKQDYISKSLLMFKERSIDLAIESVFDAIHELSSGNNSQFRKIYNDYFNPQKRILDFRDIFRTKNFLKFSLNKFKNTDLSLNQLFWLEKEFFSLGFALLEKDYPKAAIYHSHTSGYAGFAGAIAAIQNDGKFILTEHSLYIQDITKSLNEKQSGSKAETLKANIWKTWFNLIGQIIYHECCLSTYLFQDIASQAVQLGSHSRKLHIVPNGVDFNKFAVVRESQSKRQKLRKENFLDEPWQIVFLGRVVSVKGILDLIDAALRLKNIGSFKFHLHLMGSKDEDPEYFKLCLDKVIHCNLEKFITFHGVQNVIKVLKSADLMVLSSLSEALPVAVLEAMASGVPVVGTQVGAMRQILQEPLFDSASSIVIGAAGELVRPGDPESMANGILKVIHQRDLFDEFAKNGPLRVAHAYSADKVLKQYRDLYQANLFTSEQRVFDRSLIAEKHNSILNKIWSISKTNNSNNINSKINNSIKDTVPNELAFNQRGSK